jgi:hypothetical protein
MVRKVGLKEVSDVYDNNEWYDFAFGIHFKIMEHFDDVIILTNKELELLKMWMDWICRIVVESEGEHHINKDVKKFLSNCDDFFHCMKEVEKEYIIEKVKKESK